MDDATIRDANDLLYKDPDYPYALPISILPDGGIYQRRDYKMAGWDFRATANWNKAWGADERHLTNLFAGMEVNSLKRSNSIKIAISVITIRPRMAFSDRQTSKISSYRAKTNYSILLLRCVWARSTVASLKSNEKRSTVFGRR